MDNVASKVIRFPEATTDRICRKFKIRETSQHDKEIFAKTIRLIVCIRIRISLRKELKKNTKNTKKEFKNTKHKKKRVKKQKKEAITTRLRTTTLTEKALVKKD